MKNLINHLKLTLRLARLRRALNPDRAFLNSARARFLQSLAPERIRPHHHVLRWGYVFAVIVIVIGGASGLAAFADVKNVSASSPLYQLKRVSEQTRLVLTPVQRKSAVHAQLAERRLKEIEDADSLPMVKQLDEDFHNEINKVIEQSDEQERQEQSEVKSQSAIPTNTDIKVKKISGRQDREERKAHVCQLAVEAVSKHLIEPRHGGNVEKRCGISED